MLSVEVYDPGGFSIFRNLVTQSLVFHIIRDKCRLTYLMDKTVFFYNIKEMYVIIYFVLIRWPIFSL
jgi:hypothetical protein